MTDYEFVAHAEIQNRKWLTRSLAHLDELTFSHYDGVVVPSPAFMDWYTRRPGMDPALCQAILAGGELVSSLFVTIARMRLNEDILLCGIVDTVMTHVDHRRRGLASRLLERAIEGMREAGAELSLLYTAVADPPAAPQRLYESLDYSTYELVDRFIKAPPHVSERDPAARVMPHVEARREFEARLGWRSGWLPLDDALWAWRRVDRPAEYPVTLHRARDGTLATVCCGTLLAGGRQQLYAVVSDLAAASGQVREEALRSFLSTIPADATATVLCPRSDTSLAHALEAVGFRAAGAEAAMLLPLSARAAGLVTGAPGSWYVAVESVVGV